MNSKAIYYALSRMFLPTLSVILLALMWSLNPVKTFNFLLSDNTWAGVIRIVLIIAEILWFYHLYDNFLNDEKLNEKLKQDLKKDYALKYGEIGGAIKDITQNDYQKVYNFTHLKEHNCFVIKY